MEIKKIVRGTTEKVEEPKAEENRAEELNTEESKNEVPKAEESKAENVFDGKALLESLREGYGQMQRTTDRFLNGYFSEPEQVICSKIWFTPVSSVAGVLKAISKARSISWF